MQNRHNQIASLFNGKGDACRLLRGHRKNGVAIILKVLLEYRNGARRNIPAY